MSTEVEADDRTVQCEHIDREFWLYITAELLVQCELELNNNNYNKPYSACPALPTERGESTGVASRPDNNGRNDC